jgi:hypothetical protein
MTSPAESEKSLSSEQRHAILNQLHIASAVVEQLQERITDPQQQQDLQSAYDALWRAINLIRQTK